MIEERVHGAVHLDPLCYKIAEGAYLHFKIALGFSEIEIAGQGLFYFGKMVVVVFGEGGNAGQVVAVLLLQGFNLFLRVSRLRLLGL
jgi:hypothetical protein